MTSHHTISSITKYTRYHHKAYILSPKQQNKKNFDWRRKIQAQALVSFKKYMPPPLPYFKVNICPLSLPHYASIFFAYLRSFRWPNYIVTLPRYFSFRLPHLNIRTGPPSDELDQNIQRTCLGENFSHWNGYSHFRSGLSWFRKKKGALKIKCQ
jgi:hypothetical protein